jgi:hypothetical protein
MPSGRVFTGFTGMIQSSNANPRMMIRSANGHRSPPATDSVVTENSPFGQALQNQGNLHLD